MSNDTAGIVSLSVCMWVCSKNGVVCSKKSVVKTQKNTKDFIVIKVNNFTQMPMGGNVIICIHRECIERYFIKAGLYYK